MKKRCSFCKKEIDFFAKECPYCYEEQGIPVLILGLISIIIIFVIFMLVIFMV